MNKNSCFGKSQKSVKIKKSEISKNELTFRV